MHVSFYDGAVDASSCRDCVQLPIKTSCTITSFITQYTQLKANKCFVAVLVFQLCTIASITAGGDGAISPAIKYTGARVYFRPQVLAIFWAVLCPECVLRPGLRPRPRWRSLQLSPTPRSRWERARCPSPRTPPRRYWHFVSIVCPSCLRD